MLNGLGAPELLIICVIVVTVFGAGKLARTMGDLGQGIRGFREGLAGDAVGEKRLDG